MREPASCAPATNTRELSLQPSMTNSEGLAGRHRKPTVGSNSALARFLDGFIFYSLLVVISLTAVPYGTVEPWWKAVFECAVFTLGLLWVVYGLMGGTWFVRQHRLLIPILALVIFAVFQAILPLRSSYEGISSSTGLLPSSFSPYDTKLFAYQLFALMVVAGLLLRHTTSRRRLMTLICVVVCVGLGSTVFGLVRMVFQEQPGFLLPHLQLDRGMGGVGFAQFINHNHFAFLAEMSLGLVLGLMLRRPMTFARLALGLGIDIPMWIAIAYSGSRGGLVSMMGQVLFVALMVFIAGPFIADRGRQLLKDDRGPQRSRRMGSLLVTRIVLIASFLVVMVVGIIWIGGDQLASRLETVPNELGVEGSDKHIATYRSTIWTMTWQMIKDHPVAGVGFGGYWIAITKYHYGSGEMTPQQAHNDYLELLASGGLIALVIGLWFIVLFLRESFSSLRASDPFLRASRFGALAGIFAVAIHSIVDFGLHVTINTLVFVVLVVIATVRVRAIPSSGVAQV